MGLDVPVKQTISLYEKSNEVELENVEEFSESCEDIYNEVTSEISVFKKSGTNIEVILSVGKEEPALVFTVQLLIDSLDKEAIESIMELIELAMSKYKKTERTISSNFTQI